LWKPGDAEQRIGRIQRQGNMYDNVHVFQYSTEKTFDAYLYQILEKKQMFISQIMKNDYITREYEELDSEALKYAEIKALCVGDQRIKEKADIDNDVQKLQLERSAHLKEQENLKHFMIKAPGKIDVIKKSIKDINVDITGFKQFQKEFAITIKGITYTKRADAAKAIESVMKNARIGEIEFGSYKLLKISLNRKFLGDYLKINGNYLMEMELGKDGLGNIRRIENIEDKYSNVLEQLVMKKDSLERQLANTKDEVGKSFPKENELSQKLERQSKLTFELEYTNYESKDVSDKNEKVIVKNKVVERVEPVKSVKSKGDIER
jgi:hypothetical protein